MHYTYNKVQHWLGGSSTFGRVSSYLYNRYRDGNDCTASAARKNKNNLERTKGVHVNINVHEVIYFQTAATRQSVAQAPKT